MKYFKAVFSIIFVFTLFFAAGCGKSGGREVLATINNNDKITLSEFENIISKLPERYREIVGKNKKEFLDELIVDRLLYNEGMEKKVDRTEEVRNLIKEAKKKIVMARLLKDEVEDAVSVSEEEISKYYMANQDKFTTQETLRASHILVRSEEDANNVLVELSNGRNFEDLARARSIDPTSEIGGDIGFFTRNQLVPEFEDECFNMNVGQISGIVKTKFGYHVIKLTEKKEPRVKELTGVRDSIEQSMARLKKKVLFNKFVTSLKERSKITINSDLLERISEEKGSDKKSE